MTSPNTSGRSGATRDTGAVRADRRRRPLWLLLLGLLLLLLIIAAILIATLSSGSKKKAVALAPAPVTSPVGVPSVAPSSFIPTAAATIAAAAVPTPAAPSSTVAAPASAAPASVAPASVAPASPAATKPAPSAAASSGPPLIGGGPVSPKAATGTLAAGDTEGTVLFAENSAELTANAKKVISDAAAKIKANRPPQIVVTGYTDTIAGQPSNLTLSKQRAENVESQLHNDVGPGATAYSTNAIGEEDPVATNATDAGRQLNRRATITTD